jgi:hypothetical protein
MCGHEGSRVGLAVLGSVEEWCTILGVVGREPSKLAVKEAVSENPIKADVPSGTRKSLA